MLLLCYCVDFHKLLLMGVIFILNIVYISQLKFSVLEFPAVTICNQNQFRMDRAPDDLKGLLDDFMESKRADMFGGKDRLKAFERRKYFEISLPELNP